MKLREPDDPQPWEVAVAKTCVQDFLGQGNRIAGMDFDDLYQECILHWLGKKHKFRITAGASAKTFMATVLGNKLKDLLKGPAALKRGAPYTVVSLNGHLDEGDPGDALVDRVSDPKATRAFEAYHLEARVWRVVGRLPDRRRTLCYLLAQGYTETEIAGTLGISRPTVVADIERIRKVFEDEGLAEFLP
jgi:RNA polymerase sigma factor (sigma-70 family)